MAGARRRSVSAAISAIRSPPWPWRCAGSTPATIAGSRLYRTPPWGKTDQADFYNACAAIETRLSPTGLLEACLDIERDMKRVRSERWGPRTLDIDILNFDGLQIDEQALTVPHPRMTERAFVLMPLADLDGGLTVKGRAVADWLAGLDAEGIVVANENRAWWRG